MKLLVLSDSHRYLDNARNVIKKIGTKMHCVIHLGDHEDDAKELELEFPKLAFYYIKGNNDFGGSAPFEQMLNFEGKKFLLTHGHRQQVHWGYTNIYYWAKEKGADAVFFGHTHMPCNERAEDILLFNPGSISLPRSTDNPTFGIIEIADDGIIRGSIMEYHKKKSFKIIG